MKEKLEKILALLIRSQYAAVEHEIEQLIPYAERLEKISASKSDDINNLQGYISELDKWKDAVIHECMMTEACYVESDPLQSVKNLIAWHVANERDALLEERKEQLVKNVFDSSDKKLLANHGFTDFIELLAAYERLLAEREAMMKQEPVDSIFEQWWQSQPSYKASEKEASKKAFLVGLNLLQVYRSPLPAQQINILDMGMDQPASMRRCVQKLIEAAGILLDDKNYDGTGHELISDARNNAIKYLADHNPAQQIPEGYMPAPIDLIQAVAHVGVDFGYGEFYLDGSHIEQARQLLSASQPKGDV